jgi:hypothetical protein
MFAIGDEVYFGRRNGEKTLGTITKVNRKTYKVAQTESRGTKRNYAIGTEWKVPHSLVWTAGQERPESALRPRPKAQRKPKYERTEGEIMGDISSLYCGLSPENLYCDGEISHTAAMRKYRRMQGELRNLFSELGREVSEYQSYQYSYKQVG